MVAKEFYYLFSSFAANCLTAKIFPDVSFGWRKTNEKFNEA